MSETLALDLQTLVSELDSMVVEGKILEAVDRYFDDRVETQEGNHKELIVGKSAKLEALKEFFAGVTKVNGITCHAVTVGDDVTMSEYTIDLDTKTGDAIYWNEVIRRRWRDGLVVHERYYTAT